MGFIRGHTPAHRSHRRQNPAKHLELHQIKNPKIRRLVRSNEIFPEILIQTLFPKEYSPTDTFLLTSGIRIAANFIYSLAKDSDSIAK